MDKKFAKRVKNLRKDFGVTQESLSYIMWGSFPTIQRWEYGKGVPCGRDLFFLSKRKLIECQNI